MEILAISGSVRHNSYNLALLKYMAKLPLDNVNVTIVDSIINIPIFNPEIVDEKIPPSVKSLRSNIRKADGVIISSPEYAHGIPGGLKNTLDWLVASDALVLKPITVSTVSTSGLGGVRAYSSLVQILSAMNSHVVIDSSLCVPYAKLKFSASLELTDEITKAAVDVSMTTLMKVIKN